MKITFESDNIADLKLQIQEYSLAHLGLNIKAMAEQMAPKPEKIEPVINEPGVSESVRLNDGTVRLHNPSYPGKMKPIDPNKRPRGRQLGWRKPKPPEETVMPIPIVAMVGVTKEDVKAAIHALAAAKTLDVARAALDKFGAKHLDDVSPANFEALLDHCKELQNG